MRPAAHLTLALAMVVTVSASLGAGEPSDRQTDGSSPPRPLNGTVRLVLANGIGQANRFDLRLELNCDNGTWRKDVFGRGLNRMVHSGQVRRIEIGAEQSTLDINMAVDSDAWIRGYKADYQLMLRVHDRKVEGAYKCRAPGQEYEGPLSGRVEDFVEVAKDFVPPGPGEHPRLLIRRSEIPRLQQVAQTPWGKALVERMKAIRPVDRSIADAPGDPYLPRGINAYGLANGLLYNLTGEQPYADNCKRFIEMTWNDNSGGNNMDDANRRLTVALTYDLAYHGLASDFRGIAAEWIADALAANLRLALKMTNIHSDVYLCGAAQDPAAPAPEVATPQPEPEAPAPAEPDPSIPPRWRVTTKPEPPRPPPPRPSVAVTERELQRIDQWMQGDPCFGHNSEARGAWPVCVLQIAAQAYLNATGKRLPNASNLLPAYTAVGRDIDWDIFATGFRQVPESWKPAVLWAWKRLPDCERNPVFTFINFPQEGAPRNPAEVLPNPYFNPIAGFCQFRRSWGGNDDIAVDAYFKCFPANYTTRPNAGSFGISGLGHTWVPRGTAAFHLVGLGLGDNLGSVESRLFDENVVQFPAHAINCEAGGREVRVRTMGGGSGVVSAAMGDTVSGTVKAKLFKGDRILPGLEYDPDGNLKRESLKDLGIRWRRSVGVDFSETSGALAVIAVVDQTKGGKDQFWQMRIGEDPQVEVKGLTFTVRHNDGTSLSGTVVSPPDAKILYVNDKTKQSFVRADGSPAEAVASLRAIRISGGDDYFVVMTIQRGEPPRVSSTGAGPGAQVSIGPAGKTVEGRVVRFDGQEVVWSDRGD